MNLEDNLERVQIQEETADSYTVLYEGETYEIVKSTESFFLPACSSAPTAIDMRQELRLEQKLILEPQIFQDDQVPPEFKEVMIFHEIREMHYKESGFEDAHQRAENDELIYIRKFFDQDTQNSYLQFREEYRATRQVLEEKKEDLRVHLVKTARIADRCVDLSGDSYESVIGYIAQLSIGLDYWYPEWTGLPFAEALLPNVVEIEISTPDLDYPPIHDLGMITKFPHLRKLTIGEKTLFDTDLTHLGSLRYIQDLSLDELPPNCDLAPLANLTSLTKLCLVGRTVQGFDFLSSLTNLERLCLVGIGVSDISVLANLNKLRVLQLCDMNVTDLSPLANLKNLKELYLADIPVTDLSCLEHLQLKIER